MLGQFCMETENWISGSLWILQSVSDGDMVLNIKENTLVLWESVEEYLTTLE